MRKEDLDLIDLLDDRPHSQWYCRACGKPCDTKWVDNGIGPYEFWGSRGVDRRIEEVSTCCEADITDVIPGEKE